MTKFCRHCNNEIVKKEGEKARRFYCSFTCYQRFSSREKYHKNLEKSRLKSKERNSKPETKERYKDTIDAHKKWCKNEGLTITQYVEYGYTFLRENPQIVEALRLINEINGIKRGGEEIREYKREYYKKNSERLKEKQRLWRLNKKEKEKLLK